MYNHIPITMAGNLESRFDPEKLPPIVRKFYFKTFNHKAFKQGLELLEMTHAMSGLGGIGCVIDGEPGLGKSRCLDTYISNVYRLPRYQPTKELIKLPILKVIVPGKPTINRVIEKLLYSARHIGPSSNSSDSAATKLYRLIEFQQVEMIILDEFQHFLRKYSQCTTDDVVTFIKELVDDFNLAVVFSGKPEGSEVLKKFEEIKQRVGFGKVTFKAFNTDNESNYKEYIAYIKAMESALIEIGAKVCPLSTVDMLPRLLLAMQGNLRLLNRFFLRLLLMYQDKTYISKEKMSQLFAVWPNGSFLHPFDPFLAPPETVAAKYVEYRKSLKVKDEKSKHKRGTRMAGRDVD